MIQLNYNSYRAVMHVDFLEGMQPAGKWELATLFRVNSRPERLIAFDKAVSSKDFNSWVHFFIHDIRFARLFRNPWRYLPILERFDGVIAPRSFTVPIA
jgi:hypothetical protein